MRAALGMGLAAGAALNATVLALGDSLTAGGFGSTPSAAGREETRTKGPDMLWKCCDEHT